MTVELHPIRESAGGRDEIARRSGARAWAAAAVMSSLMLFPSGARAAMRDRPEPVYNDNAVPKEMAGIQIDDKAGAQLPKDLHFHDQDGHDVTLGSYFDGERPVVLVLAYYSCPMLCTLVLNGVTDGLKGVAWNAGEAYRILTVSIDQRDTPEIAKAKRDNYVKSYGRLVKPDAWDFLTGDEANVKRLADAIGFHYRWDPEQQQYAHAAGAFILTPEGKISRVFFGIQFATKDLKLALIEASHGRFSTAVDQLLLMCFHYDPKAGKYVLAATRLMRAGGLLSALGVGLWISRFWRNEMKKIPA